jgi:hypothetical protein
VLAGLFIGVPAAIAGLIWFFANATDVELAAAALGLGAAGLVKALVEGNLGLIWVSTSTILGFGWEVIGDVAHHPGGSLADNLVRVVAFACATVGLIKAGGLSWVGRAIRARLAPGSGGDGPANPG